MFREMRRKGQDLPYEEMVEILKRSTSGVLALSGDDGYPYAVPLSHFYRDGKLYFHCAGEGHKIDAVRRCDKASFCVVDQDKVYPEEFTTLYRSVIAFGRIRIMENMEEKIDALRALSDKFSPGLVERRERSIAGSIAHMCMLELTIEHLTGKEALAMANERRGK